MRLDAQVALDFFLSRASDAGLSSTVSQVTATRLLRCVAPSEFSTLTADKLVELVPGLNAVEANKLAEVAVRFALKPVSVLIVASPSIPKVHVAFLADYLRYRLPGETIVVSQTPTAAAVRAARTCATVLCLLNQAFFADEHALTLLTAAYAAKAQVCGALVPKNGDGAAFETFCRLVQGGRPLKFASLVSGDFVAGLAGAALGASDLLRALDALDASLPRVSAIDRVDGLPALLKNCGLERAFPSRMSLSAPLGAWTGHLATPDVGAAPPVPETPPSEDNACQEDENNHLRARLPMPPLNCRVRLTDTALQSNKGSVMCTSLLDAGRALFRWGLDTSIATAAKTLGRKRWHGELTGMVYGRVEFVFGELEAVARTADSSPAAAAADEPPPLVVPPRHITIVPRETLERLANSAIEGPPGIKVHLMDARGELGDISCHSLQGAARVLKAWGFIDAAPAMAASLSGRFHRGDVTGCLFDRIQYHMVDDRAFSDEKHNRLVPANKLKRLARSNRPRESAVRVRLTDTAQEGNLGSVLCDSITAAGRVLHGWGFARASLHTPLKSRKKRGEVTGLLYERFRFCFE